MDANPGAVVGDRLLHDAEGLRIQGDDSRPTRLGNLGRDYEASCFLVQPAHACSIGFAWTTSGPAEESDDASRTRISMLKIRDDCFDRIRVGGWGIRVLETSPQGHASNDLKVGDDFRGDD